MSQVQGPSGDGPRTASVKEDWYQTESAVVIVLLAKNVEASSCKITFEDKSVMAAFPLADVPYERTFHLSNGIVPSKSSYKVYSTKIEIKLAKAEGLHWRDLESGRVEPVRVSTRDWNRVVAQLEEEQPEGEAALNALFQRIYNEGSDEVKKAMNKSFLESGGTELNTNWDAVKKDKVSVKPPDGMEWKSWDN